MADENKSNGNQNGSNGNNGIVGNPVEPVNVRLAAHFVMMTADGMKDGKFNDGGIGVKTGDKWTWFTYTDVKKLIDACIVNKKQFNAQLEKERKKAGVVDL